VSPLRLYARLVGMSIRSQLRYRSALVLQILGQFVVTFVEFAGLASLYALFGRYDGWTLAEAAFLYGFGDTAFAAADALAYGFDSMGSLVKTGDFDRLLVRPLSPVLQLLGREVTLKRAGRFLEGLVILTWGWANLVDPPGPAGVALMAAAFVGGVATFLSVFLVQAALTFRTVEGLEVMNAFSYGGKQASAYPLSGYRRLLRAFFLAVVPVGATVYLPICAILGRRALPGLPEWIQPLGPLMAVPFAFVARWLWRRGLERYSSGGG